MEGSFGWCVAEKVYPDQARARIEAWQEIVIELQRRLAWFEAEANEKIEMAKEPLKRELQRVLKEVQQLLHWSTLLETERDEARARVGPLESECAQLQDSLSGELSAHVQTRQELAALKKRYHSELAQWKAQLDSERAARNAMIERHEAEIADLMQRRKRTEELLADQKKSLEFKDTLMVQLKAELTASEVRADALDHQVDSMERKLRHAQEQLVAERQMAAHQLEERTTMLDQAHQLEIDALNGVRANDKDRHDAEVDALKATFATQAATHVEAMEKLKIQMEAQKEAAVSVERQAAAALREKAEQLSRELFDSKRALQVEKAARFEDVRTLQSELDTERQESARQLDQIKQDSALAVLRLRNAEETNSKLMAKISAIEDNHWDYVSAQKTAGPHTSIKVAYNSP